MKLTSAIAVYFVIWWLTLFMVLPFGVRNAGEAGEPVEEGNEPGAPVRPRLWRKVAINCVVAAVVFAAVYATITQGWFGIADIPFVGSLRAE